MNRLIILGLCMVCCGALGLADEREYILIADSIKGQLVEPSCQMFRLNTGSRRAVPVAAIDVPIGSPTDQIWVLPLQRKVIYWCRETAKGVAAIVIVDADLPEDRKTIAMPTGVSIFPGAMFRDGGGQSLLTCFEITGDLPDVKRVLRAYGLGDGLKRDPASIRWDTLEDLGWWNHRGPFRGLKADLTSGKLSLEYMGNVYDLPMKLGDKQIESDKQKGAVLSLKACNSAVAIIAMFVPDKGGGGHGDGGTVNYYAYDRFEECWWPEKLISVRSRNNISTELFGPWVAMSYFAEKTERSSKEAPIRYCLWNSKERRRIE